MSSGKKLKSNKTTLPLLLIHSTGSTIGNVTGIRKAFSTSSLRVLHTSSVTGSGRATGSSSLLQIQ